MVARVLSCLIALAGTPLAAQHVPAQPDHRHPADATVAMIYSALRADTGVQEARFGESVYLLLDLTPDNQLVTIASFGDRRALHLTGKSRGPLVVSGWTRAGGLGAASVYYYVVRGPGRLGPRATVPNT